MFVNNLGEQLTPQTIDKVYDTNDGIIPVETGGKQGLYDYFHDIFVQPAYDDIYIGCDEDVIAYKDGVAGYLSADDGHFISKDEYDNSDSEENVIYCWNNLTLPDQVEQGVLYMIRVIIRVRKKVWDIVRKTK